MTASATKLRVRTAKASQTTGSYPALRLWWQLGRTGQGKLDPQDRAKLQAAAGWEMAAQEAGNGDHERFCQVQAIGALLFGWTPGDSGSEKGERPRVTLSPDWQRKYLERLRDLSGAIAA